MRLERKLTLGMVAVALVPSAVAGLAVVVLHRRGGLQEPSALVAVGLVALVATMLLVAMAAHRLGGSLVRAIEKIRFGVELMSTVNPEHRLDAGTTHGLEALAEEINRLAEELGAARLGVDQRVAAATRELDTERRRLAAVVAELAEGVLVASIDRRITLANRAAAGLLSDGHGLVGRALAELVDRETIDRRFQVLQQLGVGGAERFTLPLTRGGAVEAAMTILPAEEGRPGGLILVLRQPSQVLPEAATGTGGLDRFIGAGLHSGAAAGEPGPVRSELYDFSLFDAMEGGVPPAERHRRLDDLAFVVLDTETTGLHPESGDRVISLAGVRVRGGQVRRGEFFDALVRPGRKIPSESARFHGITDAMVAAATTIDRVLPAFLGFVGEAVLVGHEISFDLRFLEPEARWLGLPSLTARPILDTRLLSRSLHGPAEEHTLEAIASRLGVPVTARHSALGDALTTAEILVRLLALLNRRGVRTLGEVMDTVRGARRIAL